MSDKSNITAILKRLSMKSREIQASAVVTRDGNLVASVLKEGIDGNRVAAMCAALLGLSDTAARELDRGDLKLVLIHGENGVLLLVQSGPRHVLALSASEEIKLGSLLVEAKKAASEIHAQEI